MLLSHCLIVSLCIFTPALAQQAVVVPNCGTLPSGVSYDAGHAYPLTQDQNGQLCQKQVGVATVTDYSTTLGTTPFLCVPADSARRSLFLEDAGGSAAIGYCIGSCTPAIGAAGTSVLQPGASDFWASGSAPLQQLMCVAAAAGTPATIRSGK